MEKLEHWAQEAHEALLLSLKQQKVLQEKLTDQESRSRRNNICIYGAAEGAEGELVIMFVETLLKRELSLPADCNLRIQRAHRSLAQKPADGALPRPIIVNFLEFSTKERILREVRRKKIHLGNKALSFDHDYASEIVLKRKQYNPAKRALQERGIRFQTPFTRMQIHWDTGTRTYDNPKEVRDELVRRGFAGGMPAPAAAGDTTPEARLSMAMDWQRKEGIQSSNATTAL